jgi:hypothetical protein
MKLLTRFHLKLNNRQIVYLCGAYNGASRSTYSKQHRCHFWISARGGFSSGAACVGFQRIASALCWPPGRLLVPVIAFCYLDMMYLL